ncbi:hypothetical protein ABEV00_16265 [Paenibacillus thiaminolyticus]|uniref:hypothetical protein n=1 Tax=Paenibacillus TaxID=44249 RepID=UPI00105A03FF|nr:hypothetical protein [Paenibacillus dendritiformis]TDL57386.1 hypothetical protein E2R60_02460 [Paenibacillus dendritiformis]
MEYRNIVPKMTSDSQDGFISSFSGESGGDGGWKAFNEDYLWRSSISPRFPEYVTITFPNERILARYVLDSTVTGYRIKQWELQGLVKGGWTTLHQGEKADVSEVLTYDITPTLVSAVRLKCLSRYGNNSWMFRKLTLFEVIYDNKVLITTDQGYFSYNPTDSWSLITETEPTEEDYRQKGIDDIKSIPESEWSKLNGDIELCYYTDDPNRTEASFNIETKPFTLAEEFDDQTIKIIEYTDNPEQEESIITLETEPFTFYEEVGDNFDVLYYTDDPDKTEAELEINHNYSPLDELDGDFDLVTWTMEEEAEEQEELKPIFKEKIEDGDLYGVTVDLSKGIINIK